MRPFHPETKGPLDGIRVLDLSRLVAGNMLKPAASRTSAPR